MRRILSLMLAMAMMFGLFAGVPFKVRAANVTVYMVPTGQGNAAENKYEWTNAGVNAAALKIVDIAIAGDSPILDLVDAATPNNESFYIGLTNIELTIVGDPTKQYALAIKTNADLTIENYKSNYTSYNGTERACVEFAFSGEDEYAAALNVIGDCALSHTGTSSNSGDGVKTNGSLEISGAGTLVMQGGGNGMGLRMTGTGVTLDLSDLSTPFAPKGGSQSGSGLSLAGDATILMGSEDFSPQSTTSEAALKINTSPATLTVETLGGELCPTAIGANAKSGINALGSGATTITSSSGAKIVATGGDSHGNGYGMYMSGGAVFSGNIDVTAIGGTGTSGWFAVNSSKPASFNSANAKLTVINNGAGVAPVYCAQSGIVPWSVTGGGYITNGNGVSTGNMTCTVPSSGTKAATIKLDSTLPAITTNAGALASGNPGEAYNVTLTASGSPNAWEISSGSLPSSVTINNSGVISGTPSASGLYIFTVAASAGGLKSAPVQYSISVGTYTPAISITATGLDGLKVGQPVTGSIVYTLTNGAYASPIDAVFQNGISGLPAGLTKGAVARTSDTVITVPITGTPTSAKAATTTVTTPTSIPMAAVVGAVSAIAPTGTVATSAIAKGNGAAVSGVPTVNGTPGASSIAVNAVTIPTNPGSQSVEYACSTSNSPVPTTGWQASRTFSVLTANTVYYVFARAAENSNYNAGTAQVSTAITTATAPTYLATADPTSGTFAADYGYTNATMAEMFTITNTGNQNLTGVTATIAGGAGSGFEISTSLSSNILNVGNTATVAVRPRNGLAYNATPYAGTLQIRGSNGLSLDIPLAFSVSKKTITFAGTVAATKVYDGTSDFGNAHIAITNAGSFDVSTANVQLDKTGVTGTFGPNVGTGTLTRSGTFVLSGTAAGNYILAVQPIISAAITKAVGEAVSGAPTVNGTPTGTSIAVTGVTNAGVTGQAIEYFISTSGNLTAANLNGLTGQAGTTFSGLIPGTTYYVYARSAETANYNPGAAQRSTAIKTAIAPVITVSSAGLNNLKVGQTVTGSVTFKLANGSYAETITAGNFAVTGLPAGLTADAAVRTDATTVTVLITGIPTTANASSVALTIPGSIPKANVQGAEENITPVGTGSASAVAKGDGAAVSGVPTVSGTPTTTSITVTGVTNVGTTGQAVEYFISTSSNLNATSLNGLTGQAGTTFGGLDSGKIYYIYARTVATANYNAGVAQRSAAIGTPSVTGVAVVPVTANVQKGTTQIFAANVVGANNPAQTVAWSVTGGGAGTTINATTGVLTIAGGETAETLTVRATSTVDGSKFGEAIVTVTTSAVAPGITGPTTMNLAPGYEGTSTGAYAVTGTGVTVTKTSGDAAITWNNTTQRLDIAAGLVAGNYVVVLTASGTGGSDATLTFTLTVKAGGNTGGGGGGGGGGSSGVKFTVTFETNGGSAIDSVSVTENGKVTKPENPTKEGHTLIGWYLDEELTEEYDFDAKVAKSITLYAKWEEGTEVISPDDGWKNPFTDVKTNDWFYGNIEYAVTNGLFNGTTDTTFEPNAPITRAMFVTVLWRMEGNPIDSGVAFVDVPTGMWYSQAVEWAAVNGIVNGIGSNKFGPNDPITREQIAAIIYRYEQFVEKYPYTATTAKEFVDKNSISDYAKAAVDILVKQGIINGKPGDLFDPKGTATRAEVAAMLNRFLEAIQPEEIQPEEIQQEEIQ